MNDKTSSSPQTARIDGEWIAVMLAAIAGCLVVVFLIASDPAVGFGRSPPAASARFGVVSIDYGNNGIIDDIVLVPVGDVEPLENPTEDLMQLSELVR